MWRERIRDYLFPGKAEADEGFRHEIERLSRLGLSTTGAIQIAVSLFMLAARYVLAPEMAILSLRIQQAAVIIALGLVSVLVSRIPAAGRWARLIGGVTAVVVAGLLIWSSLVMNSRSTNPNDFIPGQMTLVLLVAVTILPFRPMHTLALGIGVGIDYLILSSVAERQLMEGLGPDDNYMLFVIMLTLLCTGITAVVYGQRVSNYRILQQTLEASDALRDAQTRIVMAESASSLSRLAAAVSHEMNNPVGALLSGVDTLLLVASRQATSKPEEQARLVTLQSDIRRSIQESATRLKELVARMQRFSNLDNAEVQAADLNEMLRDVAALIEPDLRQRARVELELEPLPPVVCRPKQLSVVFSNLLHNAMEAVDGAGRIVLSTRQGANGVDVDIEDNGRGLGSGELQTIFEPNFRVAGARVAAGNWNMFSARQIVREHGGDIRIASTEGAGTRVTVSLPLDYLSAPT